MRGLNDTDTGCTNCMWSQEFYWRDKINGGQDLGQVWLIVPNGTMHIAGWGGRGSFDAGRLTDMTSNTSSIDIYRVNVLKLRWLSGDQGHESY